MALIDFTDSVAEPNAFGGGLMGRGAVADIGTVLGALGQSLLTSTRQAPLANFGTALQQAQTRADKQAERSALILALKKAGFSDEEASSYALNPLAAKVAIETQAQAKGDAATRAASGIMSEAFGDAAPSVTPPAPAGPASGASLNGSSSPLSGSQAERAKTIYDGVISRGGTPLLASAAVGNFTGESSLDPTIGGDRDRAGNPTSFGLGQWRGERFDALKNLAASQGKDWRDPSVQLDHTMNELNGGDAGAAQASRLIQSAKSPQEAAQIFAQKFERPSTEALAKSLPGRQGAAAQAYTQFGKPVQVASNEDQTQVLEGRMGMYPAGVYGVTQPGASTSGTQVAQADLPADGAAPAGFLIPAGSASPPMPSTMFNDPNTAMATLSRANRALQTPNLPESARRQYEALRDQAASVLKPTDQTRKLLDAGYQPNTPEFQEAQRRLTFGEKDDNKIVKEARQREQIAEQYGLTKGGPGYANFILTGKLPREDQQPLSASDKKAILEADDAVVTAETAIGNLREATKLSKQAYEGPTASARGTLTGYFNNEAGLATTELDNLVTTNALGQLKAIFGAAPTEGERKILLEIQGSSSLPHAARVKIYERGIALAEKRLAFSRQRAAEMRGGSYFKPE